MPLAEVNLVLMVTGRATMVSLNVTTKTAGVPADTIVFLRCQDHFLKPLFQGLFFGPKSVIHSQ